MARAAGIDTSGLTCGEIRHLATWAVTQRRAPVLPGA